MKLILSITSLNIKVITLGLKKSISCALTSFKCLIFYVLNKNCVDKHGLLQTFLKCTILNYKKKLVSINKTSCLGK